MKIGLYSVTYRGVWYKGAAIDVFSLLRLAKQQGWEGLELDTERPHAAPMDLSADDRKRVRDLAGELGLPICAVSPNCDLSSPVPVQREAMICYVRECIKLAYDLYYVQNLGFLFDVAVYIGTVAKLFGLSMNSIRWLCRFEQRDVVDENYRKLTDASAVHETAP